MNLYYATDTFVDKYGTQWVSQQVIASCEKAAREVLPYGKHRQLKLVRADIDKQPDFKPKLANSAHQSQLKEDSDA